jgi:hypothetical protein
MAESDPHDYDGYRMRPIDLPVPRHTGSWWRHSWILESVDGSWAGDLDVPEPPDELSDIDAVVAVVRMSRTHVRLEAMTRDEVVPWNVLAYCSVIAIHANRQLSGKMLIDGHARHPLLNLVRISD